jgi:hypothetical protein
VCFPECEVRPSHFPPFLPAPLTFSPPRPPLRFGRKATKSNLYTVVNASPLIPSSLNQKQRKAFAKKVPQKAFVSLWDAEGWTLVKTRTVCQKPVTVFEVSEDGERLAYGGSDLSVGILDAHTLRVRPFPPSSPFSFN